ncbi:hypothetical protein H2200_013468 [Cladophialophora chaetospira]|uniref:Dimethylaniline monooxygenase n=1 Tax=Cladophialophora chaetospira TaxID=386627 RepID=A0AA38U4V0_9EURO|nr:hypothetical protein H2200_013468 [Cladophialophora chaetospira]
MSARYKTVAVIGTGPSGISAAKALSDENIFDRIRVFERRDRVGGTWNFDPVPDPFTTRLNGQLKRSIPSEFPHSAPLTEEDTSGRTGVYDTLDSNVGAKVMAFTHTPLPETNSASSIERYGRDNPTRPFRLVAGYLEDVFQNYYHLVSFNTGVEKVEKVNGRWILTLRRSDHLSRGRRHEYWWQETFDAVVIATGHYNIPAVPVISGLRGANAAKPEAFEHSKAYRAPDDYVAKKVVVVGGNVSAADIVSDIQGTVRGPLYLAQRGVNDFFKAAFQLPNVVTKPQIKEVNATAKGVEVEFDDGIKVSEIEKVIFATGYRLSYPFLSPDPVTPNNRLAGFYQHLFKIGDPSLTVIGQLKAGISFRVYEYQAVAVARYFAGREAKALPPPSEQDLWEIKRLDAKGPGINFHELRLEWPKYYAFLRDLAGPPAITSSGYELPPWDDKWAELGFSVIQLKDKYWRRSAQEQLRARL